MVFPYGAKLRGAKPAGEVGPDARRRLRRGSTIVEFALVFPFLLVLMIGIMECGWLAKNTLQLSNAAREGARLASLGTTTTAVAAEVQRRARPLVTTTTLTYTYRNTSGVVGDSNSMNYAPTGALVNVKVRAAHRTLTGFIPIFKNRTLEANAIFSRE